MAKRFQLFRLSLLPRKEPDLWTPTGQTREEYLREVFGARADFVHFSKRMTFVPDAGLSGVEGMLGRIGRPIIVSLNAPPDEYFTEKETPGWKAIVVAVDPRDTEDGQKAAVEIDSRVGAPTAVFGSFVAAINQQNKSAPYTIEATPLFNVEDFWAFAKENAGEVTSITFDFVAPNAGWTTETDLKEEMRSLRQSTGAEELVTTFKSTRGLDTDSKPIHNGVTYAAEVGGKIRAKSMNGKRFNSTSTPKITTLPDDEDATSEIILRVAKAIVRILGHD